MAAIDHSHKASPFLTPPVVSARKTRHYGCGTFVLALLAATGVEGALIVHGYLWLILLQLPPVGLAAAFRARPAFFLGGPPAPHLLPYQTVGPYAPGGRKYQGSTPSAQQYAPAVAPSSPAPFRGSTARRVAPSLPAGDAAAFHETPTDFGPAAAAWPEDSADFDA